VACHHYAVQVDTAKAPLGQGFEDFCGVFGRIANWQLVNVAGEALGIVAADVVVPEVGLAGAETPQAALG
jgi:hypothetical protein